MLVPPKNESLSDTFVSQWGALESELLHRESRLPVYFAPLSEMNEIYQDLLRSDGVTSGHLRDSSQSFLGIQDEYRFVVNAPEKIPIEQVVLSNIQVRCRTSLPRKLTLILGALEQWRNEDRNTDYCNRCKL